MKLEGERSESKALALGGAAFLVLAGIFLWRDLSLPRELVMMGAMALAGAAAALGRPRALPALAPGALLAVTAVAGTWYAVERGPGVLPALGIAFVAAVAAVMRAESEPEAESEAAAKHAAIAERLRWGALGVALLAASAAFYFRYLTAGAAEDEVARRLVPTLVWLAAGLAFFVGGRRRARLAPAQTGMALASVALVKAVFYDTTHLHGPLRVAVLGAVGALLLVASRLMAKPRAPEAAALEAGDAGAMEAAAREAAMREAAVREAAAHEAAGR